MVDLSDGETILKICFMFIHFDAIHERDGHTQADTA